MVEEPKATEEEWPKRSAQNLERLMKQKPCSGGPCALVHWHSLKLYFLPLAIECTTYFINLLLFY